MPMIQLKKLDSVELGWGMEISIFKSHSRLVSIVNGSPLQKNGKTRRGTLHWVENGTVYFQEAFQKEVILALC